MELLLLVLGVNIHEECIEKGVTNDARRRACASSKKEKKEKMARST
jgi:hypothetical protein